MRVSADIHNSREDSQVILSTNGNAHFFKIESSSVGFATGTSGAELLCLAIATSYCDQIYKEAISRAIKIDGVDIEVDCEFDPDGTQVSAVTYRVKVKAYADKKVINELMALCDQTAEVNKIIRSGLPITQESAEASPVAHVTDSMASV